MILYNGTIWASWYHMIWYYGTLWATHRNFDIVSGKENAMLAGNLVGIISSGIITPIVSILTSQYDQKKGVDVWENTRDIDNPLSPWTERYAKYEEHDEILIYFFTISFSGISFKTTYSMFSWCIESVKKQINI